MTYLEYLKKAKEAKISKYYTLYDICNSATAKANNIDNIPSPDIISNASLVVKNILEPLTAHFKTLCTISCMYRCKALNSHKSIKGSTKSQHLFGQAVDFTIVGHKPAEIVEWIRHNLDFDQLIDEGTWVHVSFSRYGNRKEVLRRVVTGYLKI